MPSETRSYDLLGNLAESSQYSHFRFVSAFDMTMEPQSLLVTVNNRYTAAGLLDTQTSTHPTSPSANANTKTSMTTTAYCSPTPIPKGTDSEPTPITVSRIPIPIAMHSRRGR